MYDKIHYKLNKKKRVVRDSDRREEVQKVLMEASHLIRLLVLSSSNDYFVFVGMKGVNLLNVKHLNYPIIVTHFFF